MRSVSSTPSSSSWKGSGVERETISSSSAWSSIAPVAIASLTVSGARRTTVPATAITNSLRRSWAVSAAAGALLGVDDDLDDALLVAEVDEDEPAVVAAGRDPAGEPDPATGVAGPQAAAAEVAPAVTVDQPGA